MNILENSNLKKRYKSIDLFRGIGIVIMIMGHISFGKSFYIFTHAFNMPMFFLVSGFFFVDKIYVNNKDKIVSFKDFIIKKSTQLIIPYLFWGSIQFIIWLFFNKGYINSELPLLNLLWFNNTSLLGYPNALWFITALFFAEIIFELIHLLTNNIKIRTILVILTVLIGHFGIKYLPITLPWSLNSSFIGVGLLFVGELINKLYNNYSSLSQNNTIKNKFLIRLFSVNILQIIIELSLSFLLIYLNYSLSNVSVNMRINEYGIIPLFWISAIWSSIAIFKLAYKITKINNMFVERIVNIITNIGEYSLIYVALNQIVLSSINYIFSNISVSNIFEDKLIRIVIVILCIVIIYFIKNILDRYPLRFTLGKINTKINCLKYILTFSMLLCAFISSIIINNNNKKVISNISINNAVSTPSTTLKTINNSKLLEICKSNIKVIGIDYWNESPSEYAFDSNANVLYTNENTISQEYEINKSKNSFANWKNNDYLYILNSIGGFTENSIRPLAHECYILSNSIFFDICDKKDKNELTEKCIKLTSSLAKNHLSNSYAGWGSVWQSAMWSENIGYAAWLLWDKLPDIDKGYVINMIEYEANRVASLTIPYYMDSSGNVIYPGDSKAEEIAWNSRILALASCMLPNHKNNKLWEEKLYSFLLASTATPEDAISNELLNGIAYKDILDGSNLNSDGTLYNHNRIHMDYMNVTIEGMIDTAIIYRLANKKLPPVATHNFDLIYDALVNLDLSKYEKEAKTGNHFYMRDNLGNPTYKLYMPSINDWGGNWYSSCYLTDIICDIFEKDNTCNDNLKASIWANKHLDKIYETVMDSDNKIKGTFFKEGENYFVSGEIYQMHCLNKALILQMLYSTK